jgi:hypothetical protein
MNVSLKEVLFWLGTVAYICNPNYSGGDSWKDCSSRPTWAKSSEDPISTNIKLGTVVCTYNPSYAGGIHRKIAF